MAGNKTDKKFESHGGYIAEHEDRQQEVEVVY